MSKNAVLAKLLVIEKEKLELLAKEEQIVRETLRESIELGAKIEKRMRPLLSQMSDLEDTILNPESINRRVEQLADQLVADYADEYPLLVGVMDGAQSFVSKLLEVLKKKYPGFLYEPANTIGASYAGEQSKGELTIKADPKAPMGCRKVVILEDMCDTGVTLRGFVERDIEVLGADNVAIMVLFNKPTLEDPKKNALKQNFPYKLDYVGFHIKDEFVLGESMDWDGLFRDLPGVWVKGGGDPTPEEKEILNLKEPLNVRLRSCLAEKRKLMENIKNYEEQLREPVQDTVSPGKSPDAMFGARDSMIPRPKPRENSPAIPSADAVNDASAATASFS